MRRFVGRVLVSALSIGLLAAGPLSSCRMASSGPAAWTLMFYMDSDNNLEAAQMQDLREMLAVGGTADVNLIALVDRAAPSDKDGGFTADGVANLPDWQTAKMVAIEKDRLREIADWGEVNMGDPATLERFAAEATRAMPAEHYGIVFGDHGASWPGACADESADNDLLTLVEIGSALGNISKSSGRLELVGFDACLMANFEVAHTIAPSAKVLIASEELEPGNGWNYTPLLASLVANPKVDGATFGKQAADTFNSYYNDPSKKSTEGLGVTLAVVSLDKIGAVETAVNALGEKCDHSLKATGRDAWIKLAEAHAGAEEYGSNGRGEAGLSVFDLKDLAEHIQHEAPDPETAAAAGQVVSAVSDAVLYKVHGSGRPQANGLSIFCPPDGETLQKAEPIRYSETSFGKSSAWATFLADYTGVEATDEFAPELADVQSDDARLAKQAPDGSDDVVSITSKVHADDVDTADFVIAAEIGDEQLVLGQVPADVDEDGRLHESWDGGWFTIGNGKTDLVAPITDFDAVDDKGTYFVQVPAEVRPDGAKDWDPVTLFFYLTFADDGRVSGEFVYAFEDTPYGDRQYDLDAGDTVRPVYVHYDKDGTESYVASDRPDDMLRIETPDELTVGYADVDDGAYLVGFVVTDLAGNVAEDYTEVVFGDGAAVGGDETSALPRGRQHPPHGAGYDVAFAFGAPLEPNAHVNAHPIALAIG